MENCPPSSTSLENPALFKMLVEQVKDYAIFMLDKDGIIRTWNEGARLINGYEASEIIGKHFSIFYAVNEQVDKPNFELRMAQEMGRYEEQGWRVRKDKTRYWANVVMTPLQDDKGNLYGYSTITRDLTQSKMQEDSFQRSLEAEERFRLLVEQVKDYAIFMLDARGNVASWNQGARRIKGYTADEIIGKHFSIFYTQDAIRSDHPAKELTIAIRDGRYEEEGWRVKKDGSRFWANVVITSVWDKRGNLSGFAKVTRDLTQRKKAEDALRQRTAELETFAHTLSHDLRAPVRSVCSFAEIVKSEPDLPVEQRDKYLQKIANAGESMDRMINDILQLSQVSLASAPEELISLEEVIDHCLSMNESEVRRTRATVEVRKPLPRIRGNRALLIQIFTNLLANALKFNRAGEYPRIEIYSEVNDASCEVHVKDAGVGIPHEEQARIFKVFERGTHESSGSGIGLAIVQRAVERLGGNVAVSSIPGRGSDFMIKLPCPEDVPVLR